MAKLEVILWAAKMNLFFKFNRFNLIPGNYFDIQFCNKLYLYMLTMIDLVNIEIVLGSFIVILNVGTFRYQTILIVQIRFSTVIQ